MGKHGAPQRFPEENPDKNSAASYRMIILQVCNVLSEVCFCYENHLSSVTIQNKDDNRVYRVCITVNAPSKVMTVFLTL